MLTPGGRFSKDVPGLRPLAEALVAGRLARAALGPAEHRRVRVHCLVKDSILVEPPWPEDAWEQAVLASARGTGNIFDPWVHAAPVILDFARQ